MGNEVWSKTFGNDDYDNVGIQGLTQTKDGCYLITGGIMYVNEPNYSYSSALIIKMDDSGNFIWEKEYESPGEGVGFSTSIELDDSCIMVLGTYNETFHSSTLYKLDYEGNELWNRRLEYQGLDPIFSHMKTITQTNDGGFIMAGVGAYWNITPNQQRRLIKVDSCGCDTIGCICNVNNIQDFEKNQEINIYPNPASTYINYVLPPDLNNAEIIINSLDGQIILKKRIETNTGLLNIANLSNGLYFITVKTSQNTKSVKFIKN